MEPESESKQTAIDFVKAKLSLNPEATFAEIKAQAKVEGLVVYPVVYGRAKALLGLVPTAPYGSKSKSRRQAAQEVEPEPRPRPEFERAAPTASGRTTRLRAVAGDDSLASLEGMVAQLRTAVQQRDRYRAMLEKIAELIRDELGEGDD